MSALNNTMMMLYNREASDSLSEATQLRYQVLRYQNDWKILDNKESHTKNMLHLYEQKSRLGQSNSTFYEIERLKKEFQNISSDRNQIASSLEYLFNRIAYCISNSLAKIVEAINLAAQNNDKFSLILINGTLSSILQFINQTKSIDSNLYNSIVRRCRNSVNSYTLIQLQMQNRSLLATTMINNIQQILNSYSY